MALTLSVPAGSFHLSGNPLWVKIEGASPPAGSTGYKVLLRIISVDGDLAGRLLWMARHPLRGRPGSTSPGTWTSHWRKASTGPWPGDWGPIPRIPGPSPSRRGRPGSMRTITWWKAGKYPLGELFCGEGGRRPRVLGQYNDSGSSFYPGFCLRGEVSDLDAATPRWCIPGSR